MTIYKVRLLDFLGKEVAEFGFFEKRSDAMKRMTDILSVTHGPSGTLEIREIDVQEDTNKKEKDYYELKMQS